MKNLNKKISVVVLSGLVIAGSGLIGGKSVAHASSQHKSKYESRWKLAPRNVNYDDVFMLNSNRYKYKYHISVVNPDEGFVNYLKEQKIYPSLSKPKKYFINPENFLLYLNEQRGKLKEDMYLFNIRGVNFLIEIDYDIK